MKPQRNVFSDFNGHKKTSMLCEKVLIGYTIIGFKSPIVASARLHRAPVGFRLLAQALIIDP